MANQLEENVYLAQIYDYYKNLLTDKQQKYFELYFLENYTLQEIGDFHKISRAAISDSIDKTVKILKNFEECLGLYNQNNNIRELLIKYKKNKISIGELISEIERELI